jgi:uncharacterized linocin/CFP29 family protein
MNDLRREIAPVTDEAWQLIEQETRRTLKLALSIRKLVDFDGPHGWDYSAINVGRARAADENFVKGVRSRLRIIQPLVELRSGFELQREELDSVSRGARDIDLQPALDAALQLAHAEDKAAYYGYAEAGIRGICEASPHIPINLPVDPAAYPTAVAGAMDVLREAGVRGPYAMSLDPASYTALSKTTVGGFPVLLHVKRLLNGPVVWAPALDGAVVLSLRGGDFELVVGRDISIGYLDHDLSKVRLFLEESVTFQVLTPEAAITLKHEGGSHAPGRTDGA